jgi:hypothetical protein
VARLNEIAGAISNGQMNALLLDGSGAEIGTAGNPLIVDIGGDVPDTLDLVRIAGTATAVGAGVANTGTIRVVNASDDVNLSGNFGTTGHHALGVAGCASGYWKQGFHNA